MDKKILENKNCVITGSTGGLGIEFAKELANRKCNLFLTGKNIEKLNQIRTQLNSSASSLKIEIKSGDLNKLEDINKIIKKVRMVFKSIDVLINCAGIFISKSVHESTLEEFESIFNLNIRAPFLFCKEFSQDMLTKNWGRIINIGSSSSYSGFKNGSIYCSSKHAILGLSRSLHSELKEHNVRTFCVSPGSIKTKMGRLSKNQDFDTFLEPQEIAEFLIDAICYDKELIAEEIRLNRMKLSDSFTQS